MTSGWLRQTDAQLRCCLPVLVALLAVMIDLVPIPAAGAGRTGPLSVLCVIGFWSVYRPDLVPAAAVFGIGLVADALNGLPFGLTSLMLILVHTLVVAQQRFFLARSFPVVWACFAVLASGALLLRWLLMSLWAGYLFRLTPTLFELLATIVLYPPVTLVLGWLHRRIPRFIYAP